MSPRWSSLTRQIVLISGLVGLVWLAARFTQIIGPLVVAIILAYFLNLPVRWLVRHTGWPRTAVVEGVYVTFLLLLALAPALLTPRVLALVRALANMLTNLAQELSRRSLQPVQLFPGIQIEFSALYDQIAGALQTLLSPFATSALTLAFGVASSLLWLVFILVVSFWLVKDHALIMRYIADRIPLEHRGELAQLARELASIWDAFVRGQLTVGILVGAFLSVTLSLIGMPNAVALGLLAGAMELIPSIGPTVAGTLATLVALFQGSTYLPMSNLWFAVLVALIFILTFQLDNIFLIPRFVGHRVRLHPLVIFVGLVAGAQVAGVLGILLASPTIASLRVLIGYITAKLLDQEPFGLPGPPPDRATQWRGLLRRRPVEALLFDLDGTLIETDDVIVQAWASRLAPLKRIFPALNPEWAARWLLGHLEGLFNTLITLLDQFSLDEWALEWMERLSRSLGYRPSEAPVTVSGAAEAIRQLSERYRLGIITARRQAEVQQFIRQENLEHCFSVIVTRDNHARLKPHPGPVSQAAQTLGIAVEHCALVGDTGVDVAAAQAAGALAIGVLSGFGRPDNMAQADLVVNSVFDLLDWM
jgi:HAD superfamily hydrolase (TIGR01549 family)